MLYKIANIFKVKNKRQIPRWRARTGVTCSVRQPEWNDFQSVFLVNISASGCAVFAKTCDLELQRDVSVCFGMDREKLLEANGKVVAQTVYYPGGREDLKEAIYRFSISFKKHLSSDEISLIKNQDVSVSK